MKLRNELCVIVILGFFGLTVFLFVNFLKAPTTTQIVQTDASTPPSEETVLRTKMCHTIREALREYAAHVAAPGVAITDRAAAISAVYLLCMMPAPR